MILWQAGSGDPQALSKATSDAEGRFTLDTPDTVEQGSTLYLVASGGGVPGKADNKGIALLSVPGQDLPAKATINEMTTIASAWTHNQFLIGQAIRGAPLQLSIAAGNVPSFVDLATGGWSGPIQDPLSGAQTPTMANFATLADLLPAACVR